MATPEDDDEGDDEGVPDPVTGLFDSEADDAEWEAGDLLGQALAFVTQVSDIRFLYCVRLTVLQQGPTLSPSSVVL